MSAHGISALERGYRRRPQFETLTLLAGALALSEHDRREFVVAAGAESARQAGSVTVGPWSDTAGSSFPAALTSFVGREAELEEIRTLMREQRNWQDAYGDADRARAWRCWRLCGLLRRVRAYP
jgi:hypothetical protein